MNNAAQPPILISAQEASPKGADQLLLPPVSCQITAGSLVFIIGPEYSVTSPYMNMLSAIDPPGSGQVSVLGKDSRDLSYQQQQEIRRQIAFVLQGGPLLSVIDGVENLKLAARYHQIDDETAIQQKAQKLLDDLPLQADHHVLPAYMSNLQRRLLAITRPLMLDPQVIFLDDPFNGLGHRDRIITAKYISTLAKYDHITLVICSDDLYFAHSLAQQVIYCDQQQAQAFNHWDEFYLAKREAIEMLSNLDHT